MLEKLSKRRVRAPFSLDHTAASNAHQTGVSMMVTLTVNLLLRVVIIQVVALDPWGIYHHAAADGILHSAAQLDSHGIIYMKWCPT